MDAAGSINHDNEHAMCNECLVDIPYTIGVLDGKVVLHKICSLHGAQDVVISTDPTYFQRALHQRSASSKIEAVYHKGGCPVKPYMLIIEALDECDLECPTCIAYSKPGLGKVRSCDEILKRVRLVTDRLGKLDLIMVSGGEPALHPEILRILEELGAHARQVMLITNGLRVAKEPEFARRLSELGSGFEVYLQFDSLRDYALKELRGEDFRQVRSDALSNLEKQAVAATLVCVIKRGYNDDEVCDIVRYAARLPHVRGVTFQPIRSSGRHKSFSFSDHSITSSEIRLRLNNELGLSAQSFVAHPLNPERICIGYFERNGVWLQERTEEVFARQSNASSNVLWPLYLTSGTVRELQFERDLFRIAIVTFLDKYNFTTIASRQEGIKFLSDDGELVSFDSRFILPTKAQKIEAE